MPDIGKLEVLEGFDASGNPVLRAPKRDITVRMLMLHTAGLGYDFFNASYFRLAQERGQPSVVTCSKASLMTPLLFDPVDKWEYGSNLDWCGSRYTPRRCDEGADLCAARYGGHRLLADPFDAIAACRHPPARSRRVADAASRHAVAARPRSPHGWSRPLRVDR